MAVKLHLCQDEIASHRRKTLLVVAGDVAYAVAYQVGEGVVVGPGTKAQAAIGDAGAKALMQVGSLAVARSRT